MAFDPGLNRLVRRARACAGTGRHRRSLGRREVRVLGRRAGRERAVESSSISSNVTVAVDGSKASCSLRRSAMGAAAAARTTCCAAGRAPWTRCWAAAGPSRRRRSRWPGAGGPAGAPGSCESTAGWRGASSRSRRLPRMPRRGRRRSRRRGAGQRELQAAAARGVDNEVACRPRARRGPSCTHGGEKTAAAQVGAAPIARLERAASPIPHQRRVASSSSRSSSWCCWACKSGEAVRRGGRRERRRPGRPRRKT